MARETRTCRPSEAAMPALSWPRCCRAYRPRYVMLAASGWPKMPKTPHSSLNLSMVISSRTRLSRSRGPPSDTRTRCESSGPDAAHSREPDSFPGRRLNTSIITHSVAFGRCSSDTLRETPLDRTRPHTLGVADRHVDNHPAVDGDAQQVAAGLSDDSRRDARRRRPLQHLSDMAGRQRDDHAR